MADDIEDKQLNNDHYVYFIENHDIFCSVKISLPKEYSESMSLEIVYKNDIANKIGSFTISIYRFKICPEKCEVDIIIDDERNKSTKKIENIDINHDNYLYDCKIESDIKNEVGFFDRLDMDYIEQFDLFLNRIKTQKIPDKREKDDLFYSIINYLNKKKEENENIKHLEKYPFSFLVKLILEFHESKYFPLLLKIIKPENVDDFGDFGDVPKNLLSEFINVLDSIEKDIQERTEGEDNKEELLLNYYRLVLYIYFIKNKVKFNDIFKNPKIKKYIYLSLINNEDLFNGLTLNKEQMIELINSCDNLDFTQLKNKLKYNKDFLTILLIINEQKDLFLNKFNECDKEKDNFINLELIVFPKKEDNLNDICEQIKVLFAFEKDTNNYFVKITPQLIEKYINLFNKFDLNKLITLKTIVDLIKKEDKKFSLKQNIDELIHNNGIFFSQMHKLKNIEILNFIEQDPYFNEGRTKYISVDILSGIDLSSINDEFLKKWRQLNFFNIFKEKKEEFLNKICNLIDVNNFNLLFTLFNRNSDIKNDKKEFDEDTIMKMQNLLENYLYQYLPEKCPNFIENVVDLIHFSCEKSVNLKNFITKVIQGKLNVETVINIYVSLSKKYNPLPNALLEMIYDFFLKNKTSKDMENLRRIINNSEELRNKLLDKMSHYIINENDIFQKDDSNNFKLLEGLINDGIFEINDKTLQSTEYIEQSSKFMDEIIEKLQNFEIDFSVANDILNNNLEGVLFRRLKVILRKKNDDEAFKIKEILKQYHQIIKSIIEELEKIYNYLNFFHQNEKPNEILELNGMIRNIKKNKMSVFFTSYKPKCDEYINKYREKAERSRKCFHSIFYSTIINQTKSVIKDDKQCLIETQAKLAKIKKIFEKGIKSTLKDFFNTENKESTERIIEIILRNIKEKDLEKELNKEVDLLAYILEVKNYDKKKLVDELIILSRKAKVLNLCNAMKLLIDEFGVKKTDFSKKFNEIIVSILKKKDIYTIKNLIEDFDRYSGVLKFDEKNLYFIEALSKFKEQPDAITFLFKYKVEDCRNWLDLPLESDNSFLTPDDIINIEKLIEYMHQLGTKETIKNHLTDKELILKFKEVIDKNDSVKDLIISFINNFGPIKELINTFLNQTETFKRKICNIYDKSIFTLSNEKDKFCICKYTSTNKKENTIEYEHIIELRDHAQLSEKITGDQKEQLIIEKCQIYIEKISEINNVYKVIKELYNKGYPEILTIIIDINNGKSIFKLNEKEYEDYKELILSLNKLLEELKKKQIDAYKNNVLIRYLYGRQFYLLYNFIKANKNNIIKKRTKEIIPILRYCSNNLINEDIIIESLACKEKLNIIENLINNCNEYLSATLEINALTLESIYEESLIRTKDEYKGLYIYYCDKIETTLFQMYKYLTKNNPVAQNILLCNPDTSNEEITCFLYRSILCEFNACFMIAGIELLSLEQKATLLEILNTLFSENYEKMNACLIILSTNKSTDIYKRLSLIKQKKLINIDYNDKEISEQKYEGNRVEIISSDRPGVGKSHKIMNDIKGEIKYFPFGGVLTKEEIINRLNELQLNNDSWIHLDLFDTEQTQLMMEFLFSILITNYYGQNENIFYLSKSIKLKVEIPNSFIDFFAKFPILKIFPQTNLKLEKLAPLKVSDDLTSNEQIVSNFLRLNDKIYTEDLDLASLRFASSGNLIQLGKKSDKKLRTYSQNDLSIISPKDCQEKIFEKIKEINEIKNPSYFQINTFINIIGTQLKKLMNNSFLSSKNLLILSNENDTKLIRSYVINNIFNASKYYTQGTFDNILRDQMKKQAILFGQYDEGKDIENAINNLTSEMKEKRGFSFKNLKTSLLVFHEENNEIEKKKDKNGNFSIIMNDNYKNEKDFQTISIINSLYKKKYKRECIITFRNYKQTDYLYHLKNILNLKNPVESSKKDEKNKLKSLEEISGDYVFTPDNFTKMILIIIRLRAGMPVIMMGETGCGKTALIKKLSELMNDGEEKMKILNIHAGINDRDIIKFIEEEVLPAYVKQEQEEKVKLIKNFNNDEEFYLEKKMWVFLDEINTCKSMGLITELMCKHSYHRKQLPPNIIFIGACNPYRNADKSNDEEIGLDVNSAHKEKENNLNDKQKETIKKNALNSTGKLVYAVNPLPPSLLNYVFNFGGLEESDTIKYIENMVQNNFDDLFVEMKAKNLVLNISKSEKSKVKELIKNMIYKSHFFIRKEIGESSVSLRDISRFNIFYNFFCKHLTFKRNNSNKLFETLELEKEYSFYQSLSDLEILVYAIDLSIYICYYLRITRKELRDQLMNELNVILTSNEISSKYKDFLSIVNIEQEYLIKNIELEKGISKNRGLLENLFSLFSAINNEIPIFIVGKPGCSKSLSVKLIYQAMKGSLSTNSLFKNLPKIIINTYQGSMGSTSKSVENIFSKAKNILKIYQNIKDKDNVKKYKEEKEKEKEIISMVFFDEMGLAEHSPNNPLKVLHSELERENTMKKKKYDKIDDKVAFVGISNWKLDASKMNRGIFISIPDQSEEDAKNTALTIGKSYNEFLAEKYKRFFENLGEIYFNYKLYLKENHSLDGKLDFHGNRDFYHLVKNISHNILLKYKKNQYISENDLVNFGEKSIERNFGGMTVNDEGEIITSVEKFKTIFKEKYHTCKPKKEYDIIESVKENINDLDSRYLLVESKSSISRYLLSSILSELKKDYYFYIGSKFVKDLQSEEYILKVLNKVQVFMEKGKILIMENLETVYPSMYDLFNQNYTVFSDKNYARLAIGSITNIISLVDKNFRCIINTDLNKMDQEEAPFLNRFEKQIISFEYLLNNELLEESNRIYNILQDLTKKNKTFKGLNYDLGKLLINCDIEEIRGMVYSANKKGIIKEKIIDDILSKISLTLPQDILFALKYNSFEQKHLNEYNKIKDYYNKGEHINLCRYIKAMSNAKNIVYTFSNSLDNIQNLSKINNPTFGEIKESNTKFIAINSLFSEVELEREIDDFYKNNKKSYKLCIIKFSSEEGKFMNYVKFIVENKEKEYLNENRGENKFKLFIFIVYMLRVFDNEIKDLELKDEKVKKEVNKKILKETVSNLSEYYQIFIDNLNADENVSINNLLKMDECDMLKKCLNEDEELTKNIYQSLFYMKYNIKSSVGELNQDTYINKLINYIENNKFIRNLINEYIMKSIDFKGDLLGSLFKTDKIFEERDIDIINVVKKFLSLLYKKQLSLLIFKAEKDFIFSSLLTFNENEKNDNNESLISVIYEEISEEQRNEKKELEKKELYGIIKNIINRNTEEYFKNLANNKTIIRLNERIGANNINSIIGLNLPGSKTALFKIIHKIKEEISNNYYQNEMNLRGYQKGSDEELNKEKQNYYDELNKYNNDTLNEIEKQEFIIFNEKYYNNNENEFKVFFSFLLNDYYTLYIDNNLNKSNNKRENQEEQKNSEKENGIILENTKKFLKLLIFYKNKSLNRNCNQLQLMANIINWLESYEEEISILLKMFSKLNKMVPNVYESIENIILNKEIRYGIYEQNSEYTKIVNEVFFLGMESILRVLTSDMSIYQKLGENFEDNLTRMQNTNKDIMQDALQLNIVLSLGSKEIYSLQEIIELIDVFIINNIKTQDNIISLIYYFNVQTKYIINNYEILLSNNLQKFYDFINKTIGKDKHFHKIICEILYHEFLKISDENYRIQILKIILDNKQNNQYIINSTQIIRIIIRNIISNNPSQDLIDNKIFYNNDSPLITMLNSIKNPFLDEILLNIFEGEIIHYFESIPLKDEKCLKEKFNVFFKDNKNKKNKDQKNMAGIIFDQSYQIFTKSIEHLELIIDDGIDDKHNSNLSKLYSIAYIKIYLSYLVSFIKVKKKSYGNFEDIIEYICKKSIPFRNVIKIYILKLLNNLMDNFEEFINFNFEECGIQFHKEFSLWKGKLKKTNDQIINYNFMTLDNEEDKNNYIEQQNTFENLLLNNKNINDNDEIIKNMYDNGIDTFICIAIKYIVTSLGYIDTKNDKDFQNFTDFAKNLFEKYKSNQKLLDLIFLFFDKNNFNQKIKKHLLKNNNINSQLFEIILYSFRFCVQSLDALNIQKRKKQNKKLLFASILDSNCKNNINECYIPGNELAEDLHLDTFELIKQHLNVNPDNIGCYVCSCGYYYSILPCGFPTRGETSKCPICQLDIGFGEKRVQVGYHALVDRPGHIRIFKDEYQQNICMNRYHDSSLNVPNTFLAKYEVDVIKPILDRFKNGLNPITKNHFMKRNKKIRNLNELSYRLLNYILYSHLFFANILGYISDDDLKNNYLVKEMNCIEIIEKDWEFIKEILQQKGIQSIQIFMNLIFKRFSNLIKNCEYFTEQKPRDEFETTIEKLINDCLKEYKDYSIKFIEENKKQLELDNRNIKTIINELSPPTEDIYPPKEYPLFKHFILTKYNTRDEFIKKLGPPNVYILKYPLLHQYLLDDIDTKKLKYLPVFNEFTNYMVDYYSFKIFRDDAKKRPLESEPIYKNNPKFQKKFNEFIKVWGEIKNEAIKYKCRPEMKVKDLQKGDELIYFLNDDGELGYGMYLASACQNFICWQNSFLQPIVDSVVQNGILHYFSNNLKRKIPVQSAKSSQTLFIEDCFKKSLYNHFEDLISTFSKRDIFKEDGTINYFNYNSFIYDFDSIEEELGKIILPGKCLFDNEDKLNFVTYWSEGLRGNKSDTLSNYYDKYPQKDLDENEKKKYNRIHR